MAPRAAVLIAAILPLLGGCLKGGATADRGPRCLACHAPHPQKLAGASCQDCHRGDPGAEREALAHARLLTGRVAEHRLPDSPALRDGRQLVETLACRRCHTIAGEGNRLASDLDGLVWQREQEELVRSIRQPVEFMPRFGLDRDQAEAIVAFLLRSGSPDRRRSAYRVLFGRETAPAAGGAGRSGAVAEASPFEKHCGGCHRALGPLGAAGTGDAGPNLSGLFTPFYPPTAPGERAWTRELLAEWLRNPRGLRPATTMLPVSLKAEELAQVVDRLGAPVGGSRRELRERTTSRE